MPHVMALVPCPHMMVLAPHPHMMVLVTHPQMMVLVPHPHVMALALHPHIRHGTLMLVQYKYLTQLCLQLFPAPSPCLVHWLVGY